MGCHWISAEGGGGITRFLCVPSPSSCILPSASLLMQLPLPLREHFYSCPLAASTTRGVADEAVWHLCHEWQQGFAQGMILIPGKIQPFGEGTPK